jgi:hypothetical protein
MNYAFGEASFEYFESCNFSRENTNIDVSAVMFDLRMINMSYLYFRGKNYMIQNIQKTLPQKRSS